MSMLLDCYGELLTEKQRNCFELYYNEDLSPAEIAENLGITRQGVRDQLLRAESTLNELEEKTGMVARLRRTRRAAEIAEELGGLCEGRAKSMADEIASLLREV